MEFVLNTIFWTLAFYGLYELIKNTHELINHACSFFM